MTRKLPEFHASATDSGAVRLVMDTDAAEYLVQVLTDEYQRTRDRGVNDGRGDSGAIDLADEIRVAIEATS